jgi:hypothetical protein
VWQAVAGEEAEARSSQFDTVICCAQRVAAVGIVGRFFVVCGNPWTCTGSSRWPDSAKRPKSYPALQLFTDLTLICVRLLVPLSSPPQAGS